MQVKCRFGLQSWYGGDIPLSIPEPLLLWPPATPPCYVSWQPILIHYCCSEVLLHVIDVSVVLRSMRH